MAPLGTTGSDDVTSAGDSPMCAAEQPMVGGYNSSAANDCRELAAVERSLATHCVTQAVGGSSLLTNPHT